MLSSLSDEGGYSTHGLAYANITIAYGRQQHETGTDEPCAYISSVVLSLTLEVEIAEFYRHASNLSLDLLAKRTHLKEAVNNRTKDAK